MNCQTCTLLTNPQALLYQDKDLCVILLDNSPQEGTVAIIPKKHISSIEALSEHEWETLFSAARVISSVVFQGMAAEGTNLLIHSPDLHNAESHLELLVIPRSAGDGVSLKWDLKRADESDLKRAQDKLKEETFFIGKEQKLVPSPQVPTLPKQVPKEEILSFRNQKENYLLRQLQRLP